MRILHIDTERGWRGGENQLRLLTAGLTKRGIVSHLAAKPGSEVLARLGGSCPALALPMRSELDLRSAQRIAAYCRVQGIALIDCQTSHAHTLGLLAKRFFNRSLGLVVHRRVDYVPKPGPLNRFKYQSSAVDRYVAISCKIADVLAAYVVARERIALVRSAIDGAVYEALDRQHERRRWAARLGIPATRPLIGQAAAMTAQKDYPTFLRSLARLKVSGVPFHCAIAGDGVDRKALERLTGELGLRRDVTFLGWINEVPSFLAGLDVFFMPSAYEGLGTILLEAALAGCCLIASRAGGIPEVVRHAETGLTAEVGDDEAFAALLTEALTKPDLRPRLSEAAREHVRANFSLDSMIEGNLAVYRSLAAVRA